MARYCYRNPGTIVETEIWDWNFAFSIAKNHAYFKIFPTHSTELPPLTCTSDTILIFARLTKRKRLVGKINQATFSLRQSQLVAPLGKLRVWLAVRPLVPSSGEEILLPVTSAILQNGPHLVEGSPFDLIFRKVYQVGFETFCGFFIRRRLGAKLGATILNSSFGQGKFLIAFGGIFLSSNNESNRIAISLARGVLVASP